MSDQKQSGQTAKGKSGHQHCGVDSTNFSGGTKILNREALANAKESRTTPNTVIRASDTVPPPQKPPSKP